MSAVILDEEIVHYEVLGRGRPLIFLHGWIGSWRYWLPSMQAAAISFRTYALDLWGFGDSAKNPRYYPLDQQAQLLDHFLQVMGIGKIALIGHGLGAVVAALYACSHQKMVDRMLLVSLPQGNNGRASRLGFTSPAELGEWLLGRTPGNEAVRGEAGKADPKVIQLALSSLQSIHLATLLNSQTIPSLVVYGQNDPLVEAPGSGAPNGLPDCVHRMVFDQSGHFPMLDEASKFNRLMADFLALTSGVSPRQLQLKEEWVRRVR